VLETPYFNLTAPHDGAQAGSHRKPFTPIIAHPTGRLLLRRDPFDYDMKKCGKPAQTLLGYGNAFPILTPRLEGL